MDNRKINGKHKLEKAIVDMIDEGSEDVTTLSRDTEAKYESISDKEPGSEE